jgi:hypothetical protein
VKNNTTDAELRWKFNTLTEQRQSSGDCPLAVQPIGMGAGEQHQQGTGILGGENDA